MYLPPPTKLSGLFHVPPVDRATESTVPWNAVRHRLGRDQCRRPCVGRTTKRSRLLCFFFPFLFLPFLPGGGKTRLACDDREKRTCSCPSQALGFGCPDLIEKKKTVVSCDETEGWCESGAAVSSCSCSRSRSSSSIQSRVQ